MQVKAGHSMQHTHLRASRSQSTASSDAAALAEPMPMTGRDLPAAALGAMLLDALNLQADCGRSV